MGHAGPPRSSTRCGARSHPAVSPPGVPAGAGEGMSPQPPPRGAGCVWGRGCLVLRRGGGSPAQKGASFPLGHRLAAPSALEGSEPRATCVAGQGPGCALGTPGGPPAASPRPLPRLSHNRGTGTARCWAPRAQLWQAPRAVLRGPKCPFSPSSPHNPMAIARDGEAPPLGPPCGQGGSVQDVGRSEAGPGLTPPRSRAGLQPGAGPAGSFPPLRGHRAGSGGAPPPLCEGCKRKSPAGRTAPTHRWPIRPDPGPVGFVPSCSCPLSTSFPGLLPSSKAAGR